MLINVHKLKKIFRLVLEIFKKYPSKLVSMVVLGFSAGLCGGIGIGAIIPLFSFLTSNGAGSDPISKIITKIFSFIGLPFNLPLLLILMIVLFVLKSLTNFIADYVGVKVSAQYEKNTRTDLFKSIVKSNWPNLIEYKPAYVERVIVDDVSNGACIFTYTTDLILTITSLLTYSIVAFNISTRITLFTIITGGIIFFLIKPLFYKTRKITEKLAATSKAIVHHIIETLNGMKVVKSLNAEDMVVEKANLSFDILEKYRIKSSIYQNLMGSFLEPASIAFIAIVFLTSYRSPLFNVAAFAAIVYLVQKMFSFIQAMQGKFNNINGFIPYLEIVDDYLQKSKLNQENYITGNNFHFTDVLEFKNLSFSYDGGLPVLKDINFKIKKSEMVGFIGPSGGGKTTLVDLTLRLFHPSSGEILIDNRKLSSINLKSWRSNIGYVSQDVFLMNDTIENNIIFYDNSINHEKVIDAAKMANIYEFIETLPEKFNTSIGERGVKLSGGQRQRIALARTLARKPEILILDEATSSLDNESEISIQKSIESLKQKITIIVIAHRLSTIMNSDKLFVLENGKIIEQGKPTELLKDENSYFYKVYNIREK